MQLGEGRGHRGALDCGRCKEERDEPLFYIFSLALEFSSRRFRSRSNGGWRQGRVYQGNQVPLIFGCAP